MNDLVFVSGEVPWVPDSPKKEISFLGESGTQGTGEDTFYLLPSPTHPVHNIVTLVGHSAGSKCNTACLATFQIDPFLWPLAVKVDPFHGLVSEKCGK